MLDTVKPAEEGNGVILRLYESAGGRESVALEWPEQVESISISNALEEEFEQLPHTEGRFELDFAPYEIKTIRINY
ncbi:hypothetical protein D3C81_2092730 [compost metagenome]